MAGRPVSFASGPPVRANTVLRGVLVILNDWEEQQEKRKNHDLEVPVVPRRVRTR